MHGVTISPQTEQRPSCPRPDATRTVALVRRRLLALQRPDGHWVGELQGDTILESEYILLMAFLGRESDDRCRRAANYILQQQQADGVWSNYPDGPLELSVSVKAYFALKLTGHDPEAPYMSRAREAIRSAGGAARCNSFTKFYLALLGQLPYSNCASVPPELMLLPRWCYFHLYAVSSWTRTIVVPLSIFSASKPVRSLLPGCGIAELFLEPPDTPMWPVPPSRSWSSWANLFLGIDWLYKTAERWGLLKPFRGRALRRAAAWMRERFQDSDGLGAIFPPMIYTVIALRCLGVADDDPEMQWALKQLDDLMIEEGDTIRLQPCLSPVWDTSLALNALAYGESDEWTRQDDSSGSHVADAASRAATWLLEREAAQVRRLVQDRAGTGARRLVLRVSQWLLSRYRRHRDGAHGPCPQRSGGPTAGEGGGGAAGCAGSSACRTATAAGRPLTATLTGRF